MNTPYQRNRNILILLWITLAIFCAAMPAWANAPSTCKANQPMSKLIKSSQIPCDFPDGVTPDANSLARFAWNTFIAMSWPAKDPFVAPFERGVPDTSAAYGTTTPTIVWNSWREKRELYQIRESSGTFSYVTPPGV